MTTERIDRLEALNADGARNGLRVVQAATSGAAAAAHVEQFNSGATGLTVKAAGDLLNLMDSSRNSQFKVSNTGAISSANPGVQLVSLGAEVSRLSLAPTGATGETVPRSQATGATSSLATSGTIYLSAIALPQGTVVNNITFITGTGTLKTGGTHGWYCLADSGLVVRAATADQIDASTKWGTASTVYTLATNAYTTTYTGLYYVGIMVANSAGSQPNIVTGTAMAAGLGVAPILSGTSTISQTTPPATDGSVTLTAIGADGSKRFYAYTS